MQGDTQLSPDELTPREPAHALPPGPPSEIPPDRLLRRPKDDRVLFGVAAGLGRYLGIDPAVVRVAFVLLTIFGGSGVLLYLLGLVAIPEQREGEEVGTAAGGPTGQTAAAVIGAAMILIGSLTLVSRFLPAFNDLVGPVLLVSIGVMVITLGGRR
jgi:phage shock protein C